MGMDTYYFVRSKHDSMSLCTGNRVNTNYDELLHEVYASVEPGTPES